MKRAKKTTNTEQKRDKSRETKEHEKSSTEDNEKKKLGEKEPKSEPKPETQRVGHWKPDNSKFLKTDGSTLNCVEVGEYSRGLGALWMDGKGLKSGEHYWTFTFGGIKDENPLLGLTTDTLSPFKQSSWSWKGLFYNGVLLSVPGSNAGADFGPSIWSGDTVGVLATFKETPGHLKMYFYHNNRSLGLGYDMLSSFLPEGIRPFVQLQEVGNWVKIKKHNKQSSVNRSRIRDPVEKFGVTGKWIFKTCLDKNRKPVYLGLSPTGYFYFKINCDQAGTNYDMYMKLMHDVSFLAKGKGKTGTLWRKTESIYDLDDIDGSEPAKNSEYKDFPLVQLVGRPDVVELKGNLMKITSGSTTATFERAVKPLIFKGDPFKSYK